MVSDLGSPGHDDVAIMFRIEPCVGRRYVVTYELYGLLTNKVP